VEIHGRGYVDLNSSLFLSLSVVVVLVVVVFVDNGPNEGNKGLGEWDHAET